MKPLWVYPTPAHPRWQSVWRKVHWRRHRRFMAFLDQRIRDLRLEERERRLDESLEELARNQRDRRWEASL